jgi:hypothetical protein
MAMNNKHDYRAIVLSLFAKGYNKPSWENSPVWAQWLACDVDGDWFWFELEPVPLVGGVWCTNHDGRPSFFAGIAEDDVVENWNDTLEQRPCVKD